MNLVDLITFIVFLAIGLMYFENFQNEVTYVESKLDKNKYLVRNLADKENAADLLSLVRQSLEKIVIYLKKKYPNKENVKRLSVRFNPDSLTESSPHSNFTSYTVNKGEKIVFCLRQRDENDRLVDLNTMMFVALHELAHVMTVSVDHTKEFWDNFKFILKESIKSGIYQYKPYHIKPVPYCGTMITDTPIRT